MPTSTTKSPTSTQGRPPHGTFHGTYDTGVLLLLLACSPTPSTAADLYGIWALESGNDVAVLEFRADRDFVIYAYALDEGPFVLNTGQYALHDEDLVMVSDDDQEFTYPILGWDPQQSLELEISGSSQTYVYASDLP